VLFTHPPPGGALNILVAAAAFTPDLLAVIAVVRFVRWLRRRSNHAQPP
jgi:hypothetical protein